MPVLGADNEPAAVMEPISEAAAHPEPASQPEAEVTATPPADPAPARPPTESAAAAPAAVGQPAEEQPIKTSEEKADQDAAMADAQARANLCLRKTCIIN